MRGYSLSSIPMGAKALIVILLLAFGWGGVTGVRYLVTPPTALQLYHGSGLESRPLAPAPPLQELRTGPEISFKPGIDLVPRADFEITGLVLSTRHYRSDEHSDFAPVDLALGWGQMSVPEVLDGFRITQSRRFYFWSSDSLPIPRSEVVASSANMHMIPADAKVRAKLLSVREGDLVIIHGRLVDVRTENGYIWRTSLSRTDEGAGACEVILVSSVNISGKDRF